MPHPAVLRADARRNLERVLEAAVAVFGERGPEASVEEIAKRAGVGHATVFRRFPTKDALIAAVVEERMRELLRLAEAALEEEDAGAAFERFVWKIAELHIRDRGLHECLVRCLELPASVQLHEVAARVVARAQAQGALRDDVDADDVEALLAAAIKASPADRWQRHVDVVLAGLRPPNSDASTT